MNLRKLGQALVLSVSLAACGGGHGHCRGECDGDRGGQSAGGEGDCGGNCEGHSEDDGHGHGRGHGHGHGEGHRGEGHHGDEHGCRREDGDAFPPAIGAFHAVIAPVWHSAPGAGRATLACEAAASLRERAGEVKTAEAPARADAAAWSAAGVRLVASTDALAATCAAHGADVEAKLTSVHEAFHAFMEQLHAIH